MPPPRRKLLPSLSARAKITPGFSESFRGGIVTLPQIRNPKLEIRNKPEGPEAETASPDGLGLCSLVLGICFGFRVSDFGFVCPTGGVQPRRCGTCSAPDGRRRIVLRRSAYPTALEAARDGSGFSLSRQTGEGQGEGCVFRKTPPVRHLCLHKP